MIPTVQDVVRHLEDFAPLRLAAEWDNVGLLLGDRTQVAAKILTCLTLTEAVAREAAEGGISLIVTHHPILFRGAKKLTTSTSEGRILQQLIRANIAVYSPHTAFDNCAGGINDGLARRLGLKHVRPLRTREGTRDYKLVVFLPESDFTPVSQALFQAGAGRIGNYTECSWRTSGTGTFFGGAGANPTIGLAGQREEAAEFRLEVIVPDSRLEDALRAMKKAHSYEEPAFDVVPLRTTSSTGEGRMGVLVAPQTLGEIAQQLKQSTNAAMVQVTGDCSRAITRVAVACGAAGEFLKDAVRLRAELFVTGEVRYHDCLQAEADGIALLALGHHASERPGVEDLARQLAEVFPGVQVRSSQLERDPVQFV